MLESTLKYAESMGYKLTTVNDCIYGIDLYNKTMGALQDGCE